MNASERRHWRRFHAVALAVALCVIPVLTGNATGANLTQLQNKLGATQSKLNSTSQREQSISATVASVHRQVSSISDRIGLVESREMVARERLTSDEQQVASAKAAVSRERLRLARLRAVLAHARSALADELMSQYEQPQQSFVSVIVDSSGFQQLLDGLQYLSRAKNRERSVITITRTARDKAQTAAARLTGFERADTAAATAAATQTEALVGMNALLHSQQTELAREQQAQRAALAASRAKGAKLQEAITAIQKQVRAAQAAARTISSPAGPGASAGWAIPYPIVLCESGGENLPPNSAGASGYYQIIPSTWRDSGGSGPAAYLASKAEQDAVAARIWNNGAGAGNWACATIVGIS